MSKYNALWEHVKKDGRQSFKLTFDEIQDIAGIPIDHSFLKYKKELAEYGYQVGKISMKEKTVIFNKKKNDFIKSGKVFVGRESVCMGDDVNAPNMSSFILTDNIETFKDNICGCLPYIAADRSYTWNGHKGCFEQTKFGRSFSAYPEGVCVFGSKDAAQLFSITIDRNHNILDFEIDGNWHEIIKEYPYLYLKRRNL